MGKRGRKKRSQEERSQPRQAPELLTYVCRRPFVCSNTSSSTNKTQDTHCTRVLSYRYHTG